MWHWMTSLDVARYIKMHHWLSLPQTTTQHIIQTTKVVSNEKGQKVKLHSVQKSQKKSHSIAKKVLPDRSQLSVIKQKLIKNAKIEKFSNATFWLIFKHCELDFWAIIFKDCQLTTFWFNLAKLKKHIRNLLLPPKSNYMQVSWWFISWLAYNEQNPSYITHFCCSSEISEALCIKNHKWMNGNSWNG